MNRIQEQLRIIESSFSDEKRRKLFTDIWDEYYPKISVFLSSTFHFTDTDDSVQEIMLKIFNNLERYNPAFSFNTWVYSIARNQAIDCLKKETSADRTLSRIKGESYLTPAGDSFSPEKILLRNALKEDIAGFLSSLPENERMISFLKYYENMNYRNIGRITGMPAGTVKYHVHNIKKKFKHYYGVNYED